MTHKTLMQKAIELAKRGANTTTPNPNVGCVLVKDGQIIGEGFHRQAGQPHAEINALTHARENSFDVDGASAYVTLEPCSHVGKTPPCADALIQAGIAEVIIGSRDPNQQVSGRGVKKLREAGIRVSEGLLREQCDALNLGFFKCMITGMPWVTIKMGMTLDAKIATASGESQWITGPAARADVQKLRAKSCAIMTSSATVIADNPGLNVRLDEVLRQPKRVVVDSRLSVSPNAKLFGLDGEVLVYHSSKNIHHGKAKYISVGPDTNQKTNLRHVLKDLGTNQQCNSVLVEAGGRFAGALMQNNLVDEIIIYSAPILLGEGARPAFNFPALPTLTEAKRFTIYDCAIVGNDIKVVFRMTGIGEK